MIVLNEEDEVIAMKANKIINFDYKRKMILPLFISIVIIFSSLSFALFYGFITFDSHSGFRKIANCFNFD
jgi:hypothetical protein